MQWKPETLSWITDLVDFARQLPNKYKIRNGWQKWILREAVSEMPEEIRYRTDKKGFTTPMNDWINNHNDMLENLAKKSDEMFPQHSKKKLFKRAAMGAWIQSYIK